jgi:transposase-like protein
MSKRKKEDRGRFTAKRKSEAVQRLLKGEDLDTVSRELGVTAATLSEWRETFLAGAEANLKSRENDGVTDRLDQSRRALRSNVNPLAPLLRRHVFSLVGGFPLPSGSTPLSFVGVQCGARAR